MLDDLLRETPLYQSILQQGLQEGREVGRVQGREEGREVGREEGREEGHEQERQVRLASLRQKLLMLVHVRYPHLESLARIAVVEHGNPEVLEDLLLQVALAPGADEAQQYLLARHDKI